MASGALRNCRNWICRTSNFELRTSRCLFGIRFSQESYQLPFAKYVATPQAEHQWVTVNTFAWGARYSPHYRYHGAVADLDMFCLAMKLPDRKASPAEVQASANEIARLLRSGDPDAARREVARFAMPEAPK
ncbi:MAG: hypothetical protein AB7O68_23535 [Pirellulales bacterium]